MRIYVLQIILSLIIVFGFSEKAKAQTTFFSRYVIQLKDKENNPFSIYNPSQFLSQRALERRQKQNIEIDWSDLPITPQYMDSIISTGVTILNYSKWLNTICISTNDSTKLQKIATFSFVVNPPEPIAKMKKQKPVTPVVKKPFNLNNPNYQNSIDGTYGTSKTQLEMINGTGLHRKGFDGNGMYVAVFDGGFYNANVHPGLQRVFNENRLIATRDFVGGLNSVYDNYAHGTQCLSAIVNYAPGKMMGGAFGASIILCRTEDQLSEYPIEEYNWAAAGEFADSLGVDLISSSLGYTTFDSATFFIRSYEDMTGTVSPASRAAHIASTKGIIICNSAGNSGEKPWHYISAPADADGILTVGAVDKDELITPFSSRGPSFDGRVKPDVCAMGAATALANPYNGDYFVSNGTSFSCPVIAGMTATLWQAHPDKNAQEIMQAIRESCDRFNNPNADYGYGIPDYQLADLMLSNISPDQIMPEEEPILYPNPFSGNINIVYNSSYNSTVRIEVYDMIGRLVYSDVADVSVGYNLFVPTDMKFTSGIYIIKFSTDFDSYELKAVKR